MERLSARYMCVLKERNLGDVLQERDLVKDKSTLTDL